MTTEINLTVVPPVVDDGPGPGTIGISERILLCLWRAGMTQSCLAELMGMSSSTLSSRLHLRTYFLVTEVIEAAELLGVDFAWLLEGPLEDAPPSRFLRHHVDLHEV